MPSNLGNRLVTLKVPTDHYNKDINDVGVNKVREIADSNIGQLTLDETNTYNQVIVWGGPVYYEISSELLPGWRKNDLFDGSGSTDLTDGEKEQRILDLESDGVLYDQYAIGKKNIDYFRYWVLNEDGFFSGRESDNVTLRYGREDSSPWDNKKYQWPFNWALPNESEEHGIRLKPFTKQQPPLSGDYWSRRKRPFKPLYTKFPGHTNAIGIIVSASFDSGDTFTPVTKWGVKIDGDRAGILFQGDVNNLQNPLDTTQTIASAYINRTLRIRVTAMIESDHVQKIEKDSIDSLLWASRRVLHIDQRAGYPAWIRAYDGETVTEVNDAFTLGATNLSNLESDKELQVLAEDISNASDGRKSTGSFGTIYASYEDKNYISRFRLGDEISDVVTGREQTKLTLDGIRQQLGRPVPSPMIVRQRVTMTREGTQSTEFTLTHDINVVDAQTTIIRGKNETA